MSFSMFRYKFLLIAVLALAGGQVGAQSVQKVTFLGPDCIAANSSVVGGSKIEDLKFSFENLSLTQSGDVSALNSVHCKIELLTKFDKGYSLRLKGMDVYLSGTGAKGFAGAIQSTLFDGQNIRFSSPSLTAIDSVHIPKRIHIERIGIGKSAAYCYGETVPYQLSLFLKATSALSERSVGEIKVDAISRIEFEKIKCQDQGE